MNQLAKTFSLTACALAVSALINACGGGGDGGAVVPPTVAITATGDANAVTFTFKFSADVGESFAASDDVTLIGGTISAKVIKDNVDPTLYTLVVTPNPGATTVDVTVAANSFFDLATNIPNDASAKGEYCISSCETATTSTTSTSTTSTTVAPSTTSVMTFDESTAGATGYLGAEASSLISNPDGSNTKVLQFIRSATAEKYAGVTLFTTAANFTIPRVPLTDTQKTVTLRVKAPAAGVVVRLKLQDASTLKSDYTNVRSIEAEATTQTAEWETLTFNFATPVATGTDGFSAAFNYNRADVFPYFEQLGSAIGAKTVLFRDLAFVQADSSTTSTSSTSSTSSTTSSTSSTTSTTLPGTLTTFSETTPPTVGGFNGDSSTIEFESAGSTNKVLQIVQTTNATEIGAGNIAGTNVTLTQGISLSMSSRSITLRVKASAAGKYPIMLRLANAASDVLPPAGTGPDPKAVQTAVVSKDLTTGWQDVTFDFDRYFDKTTYDKLTVFFNYNVAGANTFYVDDIKLATTASGLASFDEATLPALYRLSFFGAGITQTSQAIDPQNSANKVAKVDLAATADDWAGTVFYNIDNDATVANLLTANSQTVKLYVNSPTKLGVKVRLTVEDAFKFVPATYNADGTVKTPSSNPSAIYAEATTTNPINTWENLSFNFSGSTGYSATNKYNKATVSFNYGNIAPAIFYFENLTPAP